jgi:hypothetical protein
MTQTRSTSIIDKLRSESHRVPAHMNIIDLTDSIKELDVPSDAPVFVDLGEGRIVTPDYPESYRGFYDQIAFGYYPPSDDGSATKARDFLQELEECCGKDFQGRNGNYYRMSIVTPVWFANYDKSEGYFPVSVEKRQDFGSGQWYLLIRIAKDV